MNSTLVIWALRVALLSAVFGTGLVQAEDAKPYYTLAVSEGTSGSRNPQEIYEKYADFAKALSKGKEKEVKIVALVSFQELESGMQKHSFDFVMARPGDYPARGVRDYGYNPLMKGKGVGAILFIVPTDSKLKTISDLKGKRVGFPEESACATKVAMATLADSKLMLKEMRFSYHSEQDVIAYAVESKLFDAGAVMNYSKPGRDWVKKGGRILGQGKELPYQPFIVNKTVPTVDAERIRRRALDLSATEGGLDILKKAGLVGWDVMAEAGPLMDILTYLDTGKDVAKDAVPLRNLPGAK